MEERLEHKSMIHILVRLNFSITESVMYLGEKWKSLKFYLNKLLATVQTSFAPRFWWNFYRGILLRSSRSKKRRKGYERMLLVSEYRNIKIPKHHWNAFSWSHVVPYTCSLSARPISFNLQPNSLVIQLERAWSFYLYLNALRYSLCTRFLVI